MNECQEHSEAPSNLTSQVRLVLVENEIVRDAIDHLRDEGMLAMANAIEKLLNTQEVEKLSHVQEGLS